VKTSQKITFWV